MNKRQYVQRRKEAWRDFESLVSRLESGNTSTLRPREISDYSRLLRELSHDLAVIRSRFWGEHLEQYLNSLIARGYNCFYSQPRGDSSRFFRFWTSGFPLLFRHHSRYFALACILFFGSMFLSWIIIQEQPELASRVLPVEHLEQMEWMYSEEAEQWKQLAGKSGFFEERSEMAGFYVRNNVGIALKCFALGLLFGLGTIYVLLYNGIVIGATAGYLISQGHGQRFVTFIFSHGSFELTAIAIAGAGGLMLGNALMHPGRRTRSESLRVLGTDAVKLAAGAAAMLMIAALIEGFWSPSRIPLLWKWMGGSLFWAIVVVYLSLGGRWVRENADELGN